MKFSCAIAAFALAAGVFASPARAGTYLCEIAADYTRGWIDGQYLITHEPGADVALVRSNGVFYDEEQSFEWKVRTDNNRWLTFTYNAEKMPTAQGGFVRVRYTGFISRSDLSFRVNARVGHHGQAETAKGTCEERG